MIAESLGIQLYETLFHTGKRERGREKVGKEKGKRRGEKGSACVNRLPITWIQSRWG